MHLFTGLFYACAIQIFHHLKTNLKTNLINKHEIFTTIRKANQLAILPRYDHLICQMLPNGTVSKKYIFTTTILNIYMN